MHKYNPEILLPASDTEIRQFCSKLDKTAGNFAIQDGWHTAIQIDRSVTLEDGSVRFVKFEIYIADDTDVYEITMCERQPIDSLCDQEIIATLLRGDKSGLNESNDTLERADDNRTDVDKSEITVGYIEREKILKLYRSRLCATGMLVFTINILDDSFCCVGCEVGYSPEVFTQYEVDIGDLETLLRYGEIILNVSDLERMNSVVTRADILEATNALKGAGFMHPLVRPYRNSPVNYEDVDFYSINGDKLE